MQEVNNLESIWNLVEKYLRNAKGEPNLISKLLETLIIIFIVKIIISMMNKFIDTSLRRRKGTGYSLDKRRADTLGFVLKKLIKYVTIFIGGIIILDLFNINTTSILATAGIGGLAIGFGAQSLVKDVITGFFILMEDQYVVGDYISIGSHSGVVEELGLRVTKIKDFSGEFHIIPNGEIKIVTNKNRGLMRALVNIPVAYEENIDKVIEVLQRTCDQIKEENSKIIEGPTVIGITNLSNSSMDINIVAKTVPMEQWSVEREIRKKCKEALDRENIEIPYDKLIIYGGDIDA